MKPMKDVFNYYFRFCSEYGFEALPNKKTLDTVLLPEDCNLYSPAMEAHHKCVDGNHKLMFYMQCLRMPTSFEQLIYATQLMQAEAIRMNVEHMRRNRGRCMGSVYWQLNDSNPTVSWSSIDYDRRWKALQYFCKRFYAPVLLSAVEDGDVVQFHISNETRKEFQGKVSWRLRDNRAHVVKEESFEVTVDALSASCVEKADFSDTFRTETDRRKYYVEYLLEDANGKVMDSVMQFVEFKHFEYLEPTIDIAFKENTSEFVLTFSSDVYVKDVCLDLKHKDCVFSDNWFDIHGDRKVEITIEKNSVGQQLTLEELKKELTIMSMYDIGRRG
jgi:beta-mannosidase